ncbi:MAG: response regulator [Candidatus Woesearchaeota archaeon]|jgi:CheY-like chemotaxis protein
MNDEKTINVLLIDDNDANRLVLEFSIKHNIELGREIVIYSAEDGFKGLEMYNSIHPKIIMLDIQMPGINGWEVASKIRKYELENKLGRSKIIAHSGYVHNIGGLNKDPNFDGFLPKPFTKNNLKNIFSEYIINVEKK